ncbi:MAG: Crp/Fnr family transcriptional regulator [Bacteroidales bacterium]|nr:Crp/Fnr family transcriptional regulator [Bacteroidales bacterium]
MMHPSVDCVNCKCKPSCFSYLSETDYNHLNESKRSLDFKKGETIIKQGTFASHIIYIREGLVKESTFNHAKENVISIDSSGAFIGLDSLFSNNTFPYSIIAYKNTSVCMFETEIIRELVRKNGLFAEQILIKLNERNQKIYSRFSCLTQKNALSRVVELLLFLSQEIYNSGTFLSDLSKKNICEFTQISAESLSRILKDLMTQQLLDIDKKTYTINNASELIKYAAQKNK